MMEEATVCKDDDSSESGSEGQLWWRWSTDRVWCGEGGGAAQQVAR